jgi:hypothetical protein
LGLLALFTACAAEPRTTVVPLEAEAAANACAPRATMNGPMAVGVAHANGTYPAVAPGESFLKLGAERVAGLGARAIKIMLTNDYDKRYPETWPDGIHDLASLAATDNFRAVLSGPFETYSILTYTFALGVNDPWRSEPSPALLAAETAEIQALAEHLLRTYAGTGKTFILHNWESDWPLRAGDVTDDATVRARAQRMIDWLNARQAGVSAARENVGERGVRVLHSVEVNKVLGEDAVPQAVDVVLPSVCPDMVSYSAYEALAVRRDLAQPQAEATASARLQTALRKIRASVPDGTPIYLSEFGFPETEYVEAKSPIDVGALIQRVLHVAEGEGAAAAFTGRCSTTNAPARVSAAAAFGSCGRTAHSARPVKRSPPSCTAGKKRA